MGVQESNMKAEANGRMITFTDLPCEAGGLRVDAESVAIDADYIGDHDIGKAIALDHAIIPAIINGINRHDGKKHAGTLRFLKAAYQRQNPEIVSLLDPIIAYLDGGE